MRLNANRIIFLIIVIMGLSLRLWGLGFGLPATFHQDEPIVVNHALAYGTGDLNPHFFAIPPLTSYLLFFVYGILFVLGKIAGVWAGAEDFAVSFFKDPTVFYLAGRFFIGVIPGVLCVIFTYHLAKRFMSERAALYSSAVMAVSFLNVINSHYIYTDMLLVMFTILTCIGLYSVYEKPAMRNYCVVGIFLGLATGTKYNGALLAIPYLLTHLMVVRRNEGEWKKMISSKDLWVGGLSAVITFIIVNPFMVIDLPGFLRSFSHQAGAFWYTGWKHHIFYSLSEGTSLHLTIIGVIGLVLLFLKKAPWGKIFIAFPIVFYIVLVYKSQHFSRYVLPLVPFLAIGASYLIFEYLYGLFKFPLVRKLIIFISICWLIPTGAKSIKADMLFSSEDTRVVAADWIKENLPRGTKIACDSTNFRPAIRQPYSQLTQKEEFLKEQAGLEKLKAEKLELMVEASDKEDKGYPVYFLFDDLGSEGQFLGTIPALAYDIKSLRKEGIKYVVINGQLDSEKKDKFLKELEVRGKIVKDFSPYTDEIFKESIDRTATTCIPVMNEDLFLRKRMGPSLRIYRIK